MFARATTAVPIAPPFVLPVAPSFVPPQFSASCTLPASTVAAAPAATSTTSATRYVPIKPAPSHMQAPLRGQATAFVPNHSGLYCTNSNVGHLGNKAVLNAISAHCNSRIAVAALSEGIWLTSDRPVAPDNVICLAFSSRQDIATIRVSIEVGQSGQRMSAQDICLPDDCYILFRAVATATSIISGQNYVITASYLETCQLVHEIVLRMEMEHHGGNSAAYITNTIPVACRGLYPRMRPRRAPRVHLAKRHSDAPAVNVDGNAVSTATGTVTGTAAARIPGLWRPYRL